MTSKRSKKWPVTIIGAVILSAGGIVAALITRTWPSDIDENGARLRLVYVICTGPYNNHDDDLMYAGTPARDNRQIRHPNSIVKNDVYSTIKELEDSLGGGTVSYIYLHQDQLDRLAGVSEQEITSHMLAAGNNATAGDVIKSYRLSRYRDSFLRHPIDLDALDSLGLLPQSTITIRKANPDYNESVNLFVGENIHEPGTLIGTAYLRSIRVTLVRVENVSNQNLSSIKFHVRRLVTDQPYRIRPITITPPSEKEEEMPFAIEILQPGETITLPLNVEVVPASYAMGEVYSEVGTSQPVTLTRRVGLATEARPAAPPGFEIRSQDKATPFAFGPSIYLDHVTWQEGSRDRRYGRAMARNNLIYGNGNCECGSCPLVLARNRLGYWRTMGEVLTDAPFPRTRDFTLTLPASAQELMIAENRGETTMISSLVVRGTTARGELQLVLQPAGGGHTRQVSYSDPLVIDLHEYHTANPGLVSLQLEGSGYYRTATATLCPYVLPLPPYLFE